MKRVFLAAAGLVAAAALALLPTSAQAASSTGAAAHGARLRLTGTVGAHVAPMTSCGWTPANNSNLQGTFTESGVNIRNDRWTTCPILGEGYPGQTLIARCWAVGTWINGDGTWIYVTDETTGVTGWVFELYITWDGPVDEC